MTPVETNHSSSDGSELSIEIGQLREELRVLRTAIDELRDDVVWAARQVLAAGRQAAPDQMPQRPLDPLAPDADFRSSPAPSVETQVVAPAPVASAATDSKRPEEKQTPPPANPTPSRGPTSSRSSRQPLSMRIYMQPLLTDIVRAIRYETLSGDEARQRLEPLIGQYGREQVDEATSELVALKPPDAWGLTDDVRRFARALLGPPPTESAGNSSPLSGSLPASKISTDQKDSGPPTASGETTPVKAPRKEVLAKFWDYLQVTEDAPSGIPVDIQKLLGGRGLMIPDIMLGDEFLAVRRTLSAAQRHDMEQWLNVTKVCDQATRVWPHQSADGR